MVSQHLIQIIVELEDRISAEVKKIEQKFKQMGGTVSKTMNTSSNSSNKFTQSIYRSNTPLGQLQKTLQRVGVTGKSSFNQLSASQQKMLINMSSMSPKVREVTQRLSEIGVKGRNSFNQLSSAQQQMLMSLKGTVPVIESNKTRLGAAADWIKSKLGTAAETIKQKWAPVGDKIGNALDKAKAKADSLTTSLGSVGTGFTSAFGALGLGSITQVTVGLAMTRERMTTLMSATMGSADAAKSFVGYLDKMTDKSLVSLNDLGDAMSKIKMSTGMTNEELKLISPTVNDVGKRAILMGKSGQEANELMFASFRGLNGEFEMLKHNFGITRQNLIDTGWSGAADDVEGYNKALQICLERGGSLDEMMNTTEGRIATVRKAFTAAGRQIGEIFLPHIVKVIDFMVYLKDHANWVYKAIIGVGAGFSVFAMALPILAPAIGALKSMLVFLGLIEAKERETTIATVANTAARKINTLAIMATTGASYADASAKAANATANMGLGASLKFAAASAWKLTIALLSNPITWVVIGLIALVAAIYEVGKAFGWWTDVGSMLEAIKAGLQRLWDAFINHPDVQATIKGIQDAWQGLSDFLKPLVDWLGGIWNQIFPPSVKGKVDIVRMVIDGVGDAFNTLKTILMAVTLPMRLVIGVLQALWSAATIIGQGIYNALKPIVCILLGCSPGIVPAVEKLFEVFSTVFNTLLAVISPIIDTMVAIFMQIFGAISVIISAFQQFADGQISLPELLQMVWNTIFTTITNIFNMTTGKIIEWAGQIITKAYNAGKGFVDGVINWFKQLPGRVWNYITNTASKISSGASQWVSNAKSKASAVVTGVINYIKDLPGKVYTEFMNIGSRMLSAGSELVDKAKNIGKDIVDGLLGSMGIASPGDIQESVVKEFEDTLTKVDKISSKAKNVAENVGTNIVDGFGSPNLTVNSQISREDNDLDQTVVDNQLIAASGYETMAASMSGTLSSMVSANSTAFNTMSLNEQQSMNSMESHINSSLTSILTNTRSLLSNTTSTTNTNLKDMLKSTESTTQKMVSAWDTMKNSIVKSANRIKTDSTTHFNKLSSTIGSFYRKLQNPSSWGAGDGGRLRNTKPVGRGAGGMSKISNVFANTVRKQKEAPQLIPVSYVKNNPECLEYMNAKSGSVKTNDLIRNNCFGAGGWESSVPKNVSQIRNKSNQWKMRGPRLLGYIDSGMAFKVKEFENGTPNISFDTFRGMAEALFSAIPYDYYYDSDKTGHWTTALQSGSVNCSDGSDALIALAHTFGFDAYKQHGQWNGIGHFWAVVNGHKMDTTGWQKRRTWTPSASAGPAPKNPLEDLEYLKEINKKDTSSNEKNESKQELLKLELDGEAVIKHEFINLPDGVNADEVARLINDKTSEIEWIKKLVSNVDFQNFDEKIKKRLIRSNKRAVGI